MSVTTNINGTLVLIPTTSSEFFYITPSTNVLTYGQTATIYLVGNVNGSLVFNANLTASHGTLTSPSRVATYTDYSGTSHWIYAETFTPEVNYSGTAVVSYASNTIGYYYNTYTYNGTTAIPTQNFKGYTNSQNLFFTVNNILPNSLPTGSVTVAGVVAQGALLSASNTIADSDGMGAISYQWKADGVAIAGATSSEYALTENEVGKAITVLASYTDQRGKAESVSSLASTAVANVNDLPIGGVTISGLAKEGDILNASHSLADPDGLGLVSYQWQADGVNINGALGDSLTLSATEVGKSITVVASYTDLRGTSEMVSSGSTSSVIALNASPTGSVSVSGLAKQGQTLYAANSLADADGLGAVTYQWQADGSNISGANTNSLTLTQHQVGKTITVIGIYTDNRGNLEQVSSAVTSLVENTNDIPTGTVSISGVMNQGETLFLNNTLGDLDGMGTVSYHWRANGTEIPGATGGSYQLTQADVNKAISVVASYTDNGGMIEWVISEQTSLVANANDHPQGVVTISGAPIQGQVLLANNTIYDLDGIPQYGANAVHYQWLADGATISGANTGTYTLTQAEVGKIITVVASYTDNFGVRESVVSSASSTVTNINDVPQGGVLITGTPTQGQTLTASNTLTDADGVGAISYQWRANGAAISGATNGTYTLTQSEIGKTITVVASYVDNSGTREDVLSTPTDLVSSKFYIYGDSNANQIQGSVSDDYIYGLEGNDTIVAQSGNDILDGGSGDDFLIGGVGNDSIFGGAGIDTAVYSVASTEVHGVTFGATGFVINTAEGNDFIAADVEKLQFSDAKTFNLSLISEESSPNGLLVYGTGNDGVGMLGGDLDIALGAGDDTIGVGARGQTNFISGGAGNDTLVLSGVRADWNFSVATVGQAQEFLKLKYPLNTAIGTAADPFAWNASSLDVIMVAANAQTGTAIYFQTENLKFSASYDSTYFSESMLPQMNFAEDTTLANATQKNFFGRQGTEDTLNLKVADVDVALKYIGSIIDTTTANPAAALLSGTQLASSTSVVLKAQSAASAWFNGSSTLANAGYNLVDIENIHLYDSKGGDVTVRIAGASGFTGNGTSSSAVSEAVSAANRGDVIFISETVQGALSGISRAKVNMETTVSVAGGLRVAFEEGSNRTVNSSEQLTINMSDEVKTTPTGVGPLPEILSITPMGGTLSAQIDLFYGVSEYYLDATSHSRPVIGYVDEGSVGSFTIPARSTQTITYELLDRGSTGGDDSDSALFEIVPGTNTVRFKVAPDYEQPRDGLLLNNNNPNDIISQAADNLYSFELNATAADGSSVSTHYAVVVRNLVESTDVTVASTFFGSASALEVLGAANVNVNGSTGSDIIIGNKGNNVINGLSGNDLIFGGYGSDMLIGGIGDDTLIGGSGHKASAIANFTGETWNLFNLSNDSITTNDPQALEFNTGDKVVYTATGGTGVSANIGGIATALTSSTALYVIRADNADGTANFMLASSKANALNGVFLDVISNGTASSHAFTLDNITFNSTTLPGNDYLYGGSGSDHLIASGVMGSLTTVGVRDTLTMNGGSGSDTFTVLSNTGKINVFGGSGADKFEVMDVFTDAVGVNKSQRIVDFSATQDDVQSYFGAASLGSSSIETRLNAVGVTLNQLVTQPLPIVGGSDENGNYQTVADQVNSTYMLPDFGLSVADLLNIHNAHAA